MIKSVDALEEERMGRNTLKKDRPVAKALLMISQIGISMIVPIFLGAFLGYQLDAWLGTGFFFLVFLLLGILAAFRNIYKLTKPFYAEDLKREKEEQAYWESLKKERAQKRESGGQDAAGRKEPDTAFDGQDESAARRGRQPLVKERGLKDRHTAPKNRREAIEEEFAAWRREREKGHDRAEDAKE